LSSSQATPIVLPWRPREVHVVERSRVEGVLRDAPSLEPDLDAIRAEAFAAGLAEGLARAAEEAELSQPHASGSSDLQVRLQDSLAGLDARVSDELSAAEEALRDLALAVGSRLAGAAIDARAHDPEALLREALDLSAGAETRVLMSSEDFDSMRAVGWGSAEFRSRWEADSNLAPGEFVIETSSGRLLATLAARLESLREGIAP